MDKRTKFLILFILVNLVFYNSVFATASDTDQADLYEVMLNKFELQDEHSVSYVAFQGTTPTLDIAAAGAGCFAGTFASDLVIPDGNYTMVKATPDGTFTIRGSVLWASGDGADGKTYYTTSEIGSAGGCVTNNVGPAQNCTVAIPISDLDWIILPSVVTISEGKANYRIRVKFNTSTALGLYIVGAHHEIMPEVPTLSIELIPQ